MQQGVIIPIFKIAIIAFVLSGCTNKQFKLTDDKERQEILSERTIFDERTLVEKTGTTTPLLSLHAEEDAKSGTIGEGDFLNDDDKIGSIGGGHSHGNNNGADNNSGSVGEDNHSGNDSSSGTIGGGGNNDGSDHSGTIGGGSNSGGHSNDGSSGAIGGGNNNDGSDHSGTIGDGGNGGNDSNSGTIGGGGNGGNNDGDSGTIGDGGNNNDGSDNSGTIGDGGNGGNDSNSGTIGGGSNGGNNDSDSGTIGDGGGNIREFIPVQFLCSRSATTNNRGNIKESTKPLTLLFTNKSTNEILCRSTISDLKDTILNEERIPVPSHCKEFVKNSHVKVFIYETQGQNFVYSQTKVNNVNFYGDENRTYRYADSKGKYQLLVLIDRHDQFKNKAGDERCDRKTSPLFVDLGTDERLTLSAPTKGIQFDILGRNSFPVAHEKKQISWFANDKFLFLVNPSTSGEVSGINQMFGNNTMGPDGKFSPDGYDALAKHDLNSDGVIDQEDEIFDKLRLWSDANLNGIAEPGELFTLEFLNIKAIELKYDAKFFEKDMYGNEIRYKSLIQMKDGSKKLMFDLWFKFL